MSLKGSNNYSLKTNNNPSNTTFNNRKLYINGLLTNLSNPNVSIFFLTIFTQIIEPKTPMNYQVIYALEMAIATFLWFSLIATSLENKLTKKFFNTYKVWIDRIMGIILILLAIKVIFSL